MPASRASNKEIAQTVSDNPWIDAAIARSVATEDVAWVRTRGVRPKRKGPVVTGGPFDRVP